MPPTLKVNKTDVQNPWHTLGMTELLTYLVESDLFDIDYHTERIGGGKSMRASLLIYNGKRVYLDLWEYSMPTYAKPAYKANLDLIIKLQHTPMSYKRFERVCHRKNVLTWLTPEERKAYLDKIVSWTFFPSRMMKQFIGKEDELEKLPDERLGFFCGKGWKCRYKIGQMLEKQIEFIKSSQERVRRGRPLTDEEYIHKMRTSKYGICLHGRGSYFTEAKNRREIDYLMLKKPLVLNYKPFYYNPLVAGKHYIYMDENLDLENLENMYNIEEIAKNGYEWYKENATPMGCAKTFLKIMEERL
jgi:hypothetical protein